MAPSGIAGWSFCFLRNGWKKSFYSMKITGDKSIPVKQDAYIVIKVQDIQVFGFQIVPHIIIWEGGFFSGICYDTEIVLVKFNGSFRAVFSSLCHAFVFASAFCAWEHDKQPEKKRSKKDGFPCQKEQGTSGVPKPESSCQIERQQKESHLLYCLLVCFISGGAHSLIK